MAQALDTDCFPGAVLLVARKKKMVHFEAYGWANRFNRTPMRLQTVFDLASLTKPLATTLALMELIQAGRLDLDQPLKSIIPRFTHTEKGGLCIRDLLTHRSGLPAWRPYFRTLVKYDPRLRPAILKQLLLNEPLCHAPGKVTAYSDLGFMILAWIIEKVTRLPMGRYVSQAIYQPLGLSTSFYFPSLAPMPPDTPCAATELCPWRGILLNGRVHDDNAFATAGLQGHAGLFGAVDAVYSLLQFLLNAFHQREEGVLAHQSMRRFMSPGEKGLRPLGFDVPSGPSPACGKYFSKKTIGHLGFTGTSFWMDLEQEIIVILCTNRIHPSRQNNRIRAFRPRIHDAVMTELQSQTH